MTGVLLGEPFDAIGPLRVLRAHAEIGLDALPRSRPQTRTGGCASRSTRRAKTLVGVTYDDPDGEQAWCYNSEVASLRAWVWDRSRGAGDSLAAARTLQSPGRAHVEYAQRAPVDGVPVLV